MDHFFWRYDQFGNNFYNCFDFSTYTPLLFFLCYGEHYAQMSWRQNAKESRLIADPVLLRESKMYGRMRAGQLHCEEKRSVISLS